MKLLAILLTLVLTGCAGLDPRSPQAQEWEGKYAHARQSLYEENQCLKAHNGTLDACPTTVSDEIGWLNLHYPYPNGDHERIMRVFDLTLCEYTITDSIYYYGFKPPIGPDPSHKVQNCYTYGNMEG